MKIIQILIDRGIEIAHPPTEESINSFEEILPKDIFHLLFENIYRHFDGFSEGDFDPASFLRIWSIDRILSSNEHSEQFVPFMDFSLNSEVYGLIKGRGSDIFSKYENKNTGITINSLLEKIVAGEFDDSLGLSTKSNRRL